MRRVTQVSTPIAHLVGPGSLGVTNGHLVYRPRGEKADGPVRLMAEGLQAVYCYGAVGVTEDAFTVLCQHDIEVAFLTPGGTRCRGRLVHADSSRTGLRRQQHQAFASPERARAWAEMVVTAKIDSQLAAARHYQRQGVGNIGPVIERLQSARRQCDGVPLEVLRGLEGSAAQAWFSILGETLNPPWVFRQRTRRPPTDPVNALLSLGYTWVLYRTVARCEAAGLEVNLGGLHEWRPGRPSLACDLMEPLRVPGVDRWVISICNQGRVTADDFQEEGGGIRLQPQSFGKILIDWETHWIRQGQETALDEWVARCGCHIRQGEPEMDLVTDDPE